MIVALQMSRCVVFHGFLRIEAFVYLDLEGADPIAAAGGIGLVVHADGAGVLAQSCRFVRIHDNGAYEMTLDAMIDRAVFPHGFRLAIRHGDSELVKTMEAVVAETLAVNSRDTLTVECLYPHIAAFAEPGRRPRMLDLGGRRRSGRSYSEGLTACDVTVFDIVPDPGVDVVGDAHELGAHFPPGHFDFVMCNSVFEHLLMPWKVVLEINRVMRVGGHCYVHTHQTLGLHDMPWDFWRFSDTAWAGLFNDRTGFAVEVARMACFNHIVTAAWTPGYAGQEASGGFEASSVLVRKIADTGLAWPVALSEALSPEYPR